MEKKVEKNSKISNYVNNHFTKDPVTRTRRTTVIHNMQIHDKDAIGN